MSQVSKTAAALLQGISDSRLSKPQPKTVIRALLQNEDTYATVLLLIFTDQYGDEPGQKPMACLHWHPETIKWHLEHDFAVRLPRLVQDKMMTAISLVTGDWFFKDLDRFIQICNVLSGDQFDVLEVDLASAAEIMWGVAEAGIIWPPTDDPETQFDPEIRHYIGSVLNREGIINPPDVLRLGIRMQPQVDPGMADDPEVYQALWQGQSSGEQELKDMMVRELTALAGQLQLLPLQNGTVSALLQQVQAAIKRVGGGPNG